MTKQTIVQYFIELTMLQNDKREQEQSRRKCDKRPSEPNKGFCSSLQSLTRNLQKLRGQIHNLSVLLKNFRGYHHQSWQSQCLLDFCVKLTNPVFNFFGITHNA